MGRPESTHSSVEFASCNRRAVLQGMAFSIVPLLVSAGRLSLAAAGSDGTQNKVTHRRLRQMVSASTSPNRDKAH